MDIQEIFTRIRIDINIIKSTEIIRDQYHNLEIFLKAKNLNVINSFSQIRRNESFNGLVSETMFFDNKYIYDIVVGVDNIDVHIVLLKNVSKINVSTTPNYIKDKLEDGTSIQKIEYSSQLNISYQENSSLSYVTKTERYNELLVISDILLKMIVR